MAHDFSTFLVSPSEPGGSLPSSNAVPFSHPTISGSAPYDIEVLPGLNCQDCVLAQTPGHYSQEMGYVLVPAGSSKRWERYLMSVSEAKLPNLYITGGNFATSSGAADWFRNAQSLLLHFYGWLHGNLQGYTGSAHDANFTREWVFTCTVAFGSSITIDNTESFDASCLPLSGGFTSIQVGDQVDFGGDSVLGTRQTRFWVVGVDWGATPLGSRPTSVVLTLDKPVMGALTDQNDGEPLSDVPVTISREAYTPIPFVEPVIKDNHAGFKVRLRFDPSVDTGLSGGWRPEEGTNFNLAAPDLADNSAAWSVTCNRTAEPHKGVFIGLPMPFDICEIPEAWKPEKTVALGEATIGFHTNLVAVNGVTTTYYDVVLESGSEAVSGEVSIAFTCPDFVEIVSMAQVAAGLDDYAQSFTATGCTVAFDTGFPMLGRVAVARLGLRRKNVTPQKTAVALPFSAAEPVYSTFRVTYVSESGVESDATSTWANYSDHTTADEDEISSSPFRIRQSSGEWTSFIRGGFVKYMVDSGALDNVSEIMFEYIYEVLTDDDRGFRVTVPRRCKHSICTHNEEMGVERTDGSHFVTGKWVCAKRVYQVVTGFTGGEVLTPIWETQYATGFDAYVPRCYQPGTCSAFEAIQPTSGAAEASNAMRQLWNAGNVTLYQINVANANASSFILRRKGVPSLKFLTTTERTMFPVTYTNYEEPQNEGGYGKFGTKEYRDEDAAYTLVDDEQRFWDGFSYSDKSYPDYGSGEKSFTGVMPFTVSDFTTKRLPHANTTVVEATHDYGADLIWSELRHGFSYGVENYSTTREAMKQLSRVTTDQTRLLLAGVKPVYGIEQSMESGKTTFRWQLYDEDFQPIAGQYYPDTIADEAPEGAIYLGKVSVGNWTPDNHPGEDGAETVFNTAEIMAATVDSGMVRLELKNKKTTAGHIVTGYDGSYDRIVHVMAGGQTVNLPTWARITNRYVDPSHGSNGPNPTGVYAGCVGRIALDDMGETGFYVEKARACYGEEEAWMPPEGWVINLRGLVFINSSTSPNVCFRKAISGALGAANLTVSDGTVTLSPHPDSNTPMQAIDPKVLGVDEYYWRAVAYGASGQEYIEVWFSDKRVPDPDGVAAPGEKKTEHVTVTVNFSGGGSSGPHSFSLARANVIFPDDYQPKNGNMIHYVKLMFGLTVDKPAMLGSDSIMYDYWPFPITLAHAGSTSGGFPTANTPASASWPGNWSSPRHNYQLVDFTVGPSTKRGILLPAISGYQFIDISMTMEEPEGYDDQDYYDSTFGLCPGIPRGFEDWGNKRDVVWLKDVSGRLAARVGTLVGKTVQFTRAGKISHDSTLAGFRTDARPGTPGSMPAPSGGGWDEVEDLFEPKSFADGDLFIPLLTGLSLFSENKAMCLSALMRRTVLSNPVIPKDFTFFRDCAEQLDTAISPLLGGGMLQVVENWRMEFPEDASASLYRIVGGTPGDFRCGKLMDDQVEDAPESDWVPYALNTFDAFECPIEYPICERSYWAGQYTGSSTYAFCGYNIQGSSTPKEGVQHQVTSPFYYLSAGLFWNLPVGAVIGDCFVEVELTHAEIDLYTIDQELKLISPEHPPGVPSSWSMQTLSSSFASFSGSARVLVAGIAILADEDSCSFDGDPNYPVNIDSGFTADFFGLRSLGDMDVGDKKWVNVGFIIRNLFLHRFDKPYTRLGLLFMIDAAGSSFNFASLDEEETEGPFGVPQGYIMSGKMFSTFQEVDAGGTPTGKFIGSAVHGGRDSRYFSAEYGITVGSALVVEFTVGADEITRYPAYRNNPPARDPD